MNRVGLACEERHGLLTQGEQSPVGGQRLDYRPRTRQPAACAVEQTA